MRKILLTSALLFTLVAAGTLGASRAIARDGSDDNTGASDSATTTSNGAAKTAEVKAETEAKAAEAKKEAATKKAEGLKTSCEQRKESINKKISALGENAQKHQEAYTKLLNEAIELKTTRSLSPANFDALVATANGAKATSNNSIEALKASSLSTDCSVADITGSISAGKTAGKAAKAAVDKVKSDLKNYRNAVKAVLLSLEAVTTE